MTNDGEVLRIEPTKLQPTPLTLDLSALAEIGLGLREDHQLSYDPEQAKRGENIVESFLTTLGRMADLAASQEEPAKSKWDLDNLKKLQLLVGGLDECGVVEILDDKTP